MPFVYFFTHFLQKKSFSVLDGVLVLRNQVGIDRLANSCDANFIHVSKGIVCDYADRAWTKLANQGNCRE